MSSSSSGHVNEVMDKDVAKQQPLATLDDIKKAFPTTDTLRYITNDTYAGAPTKILGRVYYEKIGSNAFIPFHTSIDAIVDEKSVLEGPQIVSEFIVSSKMTATGNYLSFLSLSLESDELYELRIINNASGRVIDKGDAWDQALVKWMNNPLCEKLITDTKVGTISIVTGVVQKYLTSKKYKKFDGKAKGGGWGANVAGSLYLSSSEFRLDVVYGLDLVSISQVNSVNEFAEKIAIGDVLSKEAELTQVNALFDRMVMKHASIF